MQPFPESKAGMFSSLDFTIWYLRRTRTDTSIANKHGGLQACSGPLNEYYKGYAVWGVGCYKCYKGATTALNYNGITEVLYG